MPPRTEAGGSSLPKVGSSTAYSIYPTDSVQDVAESIGLPPLKESVAAALAADVEYRLRQIVQDASKFMRHGKRSQLRVCDIDRALKQRNIEPIFGFHPSTLGKSSVSGAYPTAVGSTFRRIQTQTGTIHILADEEIDLERVLENGPKVALGPGVGWSAHWLAIEGVQPAVPQNPVLSTVAVQPSAVDPSSTVSTTTAVHINGASAVLPGHGGSANQATAKPLIKHVLSRELQLYFERLTTAIIDPPREAEVEGSKTNGEVDEIDRFEERDADGDVSMVRAEKEPNQNRALEEVEAMAKRTSGNTVRDAALASLRGDSGLHQLVPYLIQWVGEKVQSGLQDEKMLEVMLHTINAIVTNPFLGIELYLHQLLPFVVSILLTSSLGTSASTLTYVLRTRAGSLLSYIIERYDGTYPTLRPRLVRTILIALNAGCKETTFEEEEQQNLARQSPASPFDTEVSPKGPRESASTKLGALIGLRRIGPSAIRTLLVQTQDQSSKASCQLKRLGNWCERTEMVEERRGEIKAVEREVIVSDQKQKHRRGTCTDSFFLSLPVVAA
jgi:transcription initiation factor TFIID subunit 6